MPEHTIQQFPKSRIATIDIGAVGLRKHHIAALIEVDVTECRMRLQALKAGGKNLSFTAWLVSVIGRTIKDHKIVAAYRSGKRSVILFENVNVSMVVEKDLNGKRVPIPLVIEKAQERSVESISRQIREAQEKPLTEQDIVLQRRSGRLERLYYWLPGFLRRWFWHYLLSSPQLAFRQMGNVAVTSIGMMGNVHGWFIPISVHPVCFGISRVVQKPVVVDGSIAIREMLNLTILLDHDVIDGAPMARFIGALVENIEKGEFAPV